MTLDESPIPEFEQEMENTRKILERIPDDKLSWKPHEKSMSLRQLASHVMDAPDWASHVVSSEVLEIGSDFKPYVVPNRQELLAEFDRRLAEMKKSFGAAPLESLKAEWSLVFGGKTVLKMPRPQVLRSIVLNHHIHHRGQLTVYLRLLDVPFPGVYGPSADDPRMF